jgi:uncharacterized membrane protein
MHLRHARENRQTHPVKNMNTQGDGSYNNPYAPPTASVENDEYLEQAQGSYIPGGRKVPAARGATWVGEAWSMFKASPIAWIVMFVLFFLCMLILLLLPVLVRFVANALVMPLLLGGVMLACQHQRETGTLQIADLFGAIRSHAGPLLIQGILALVLLVLLGILIGILSAISLAGQFALLKSSGFAPNLGMLVYMLLLLLVCSLYIVCVSASTWFAPALIVLHDIGTVDAMKASFQGCWKNWSSMLVYSLLGFVVLIVSLIPFGLGLLVALPMFQASIYTSYRDIFVED